MFAALVLLIQSIPRAQAISSGQVDIASAADERAIYGLTADPEIVADIVTSGRDVGTPRWGIVLTAEEERDLDLPGRMAFVNEASNVLLPYVESLDTFAGAFYEPHHNGRLVILLTEVSHDVEAEIRAREPFGSRGVVVERATIPYVELQQAAGRIWDEWPVGESQRPTYVGIEESANRLTVEVANLTDSVLLAVRHLEEELGVQIVATSRAQPADLACTSRFQCYDPEHRAGVRIDQGSAHGCNELGENCCTMGFHIIVPGGDKQTLTAGHCSYFGSLHWYHGAVGSPVYVGYETATMYDTPYERDIARVTMSDSRASFRIFEGWEVRGYGVANAGAPICASLGLTNYFDCGTITERFVGWISAGCGCEVWGGRYSGIDSHPGDSGSPMFSFIDWDLGYVRAYGLVNREHEFVWVKHGLEHWGAQLITS